MRVIFVAFHEQHEPGDQATLAADIAAALVAKGICIPDPAGAPEPSVKAEKAVKK